MHDGNRMSCGALNHAHVNTFVHDDVVDHRVVCDVSSLVDDVDDSYRVSDYDTLVARSRNKSGRNKHPVFSKPPLVEYRPVPARIQRADIKATKSEGHSDIAPSFEKRIIGWQRHPTDDGAV